MNGFGFHVEVSRTARKKSASIELDGNLVKLSVPKFLSDTRVRELISKRSAWILRKLKEQSEQPQFGNQDVVERQFSEG